MTRSILLTTVAIVVRSRFSQLNLLLVPHVLLTRRIVVETELEGRFTKWDQYCVACVFLCEGGVLFQFIVS